MQMRKILLAILITLLPACTMAGVPHSSIQPVTIDGKPALRFSEGNASVTVVRTGSAVDPVFTFHVTPCSLWTCHSGQTGYLSVSAQGVHWQSSVGNDDSFDVPLSTAKFSTCMSAYVCLDISGKRHIFSVVDDDGKNAIDIALFKVFYKFLSDTVQSFSDADAAFWQLRGEPLPTVAMAAFHDQAAAWRALAVKPDLPEEVRKQRLLAESYLRDKDFKGSIEHYELGVKAAPTWPEGWFNLALLYGETGDYSAAAASMKNYLALMPDSPDAPAARDKIVIWEDKAAKGKQ